MKTASKMQAVITELAKKHTVDVLKPGALLMLEMKGYDQLRIECLPIGTISVAHVFESQGRRIPDPDVCFFVDAQGDWVPINITQILTGYTSYAELNEEANTILRYNREGQEDLAIFCSLWAQNLRDQGWLKNAKKHKLSGNHLFELGQIVATPGALQALEKTGQTPDEFISRHVSGDWGDLDEHDVQENNDALKRGGRLFSAYHLSDGTKIWLITEWDRSVSTLLLPLEY